MYLERSLAISPNLALPIHHGDTVFSRQPMPAPASWRSRGITYQRRINSGRTTPFAVAPRRVRNTTGQGRNFSFPPLRRDLLDHTVGRIFALSRN
jgi:hypothetical protein